jgi:hypothetical protein
MTSLDFSKALSVPGCLISSTKRELNIRTPCGDGACMDRACAGGACAGGACVDGACVGGACTGGACGDGAVVVFG